MRAHWVPVGAPTRCALLADLFLVCGSSFDPMDSRQLTAANIDADPPGTSDQVVAGVRSAVTRFCRGGTPWPPRVNEFVLMLGAFEPANQSTNRGQPDDIFSFRSFSDQSNRLFAAGKRGIQSPLSGRNRTATAGPYSLPRCLPVHVSPP